MQRGARFDDFAFGRSVHALEVAWAHVYFWVGRNGGLFDRNFYYMQSKYTIATDGKSIAELVAEITRQLA